MNCGIQVQLNEQDTEIVCTRGDENHPASQGYVCNKAPRLNFYQKRDNRLLSPMKRNTDGGYDPIDWNTAVTEIAAKLEKANQPTSGATRPHTLAPGQVGSSR